MSAWARIESPSADRDALLQIAAAITEQRLVASPPFLLEAGSSARSGHDHDRLMTQLGALPFAALDREAERCSLQAQAELARGGHHRLPPVDLLIASIAHVQGFGVLHCDRHYDLIAERTFLRYQSVWVAGSRL